MPPDSLWTSDTLMQQTETIIDNGLDPIKHKISAGGKWLFDAFFLYRRAPLVWTVMILLVCVAFLTGAVFFRILLASVLGVAAIPVALTIACSLLIPILLGGIVHTAKRADEGEPIELTDFLQIYSLPQAGALLRIGLYCLLGIIALATLVSLFWFASTRLGIWSVPFIPERGLLRPFWPFILMFISSSAMLCSAVFYAPMLVVLQNMSAPEAMRLSFLGFWRNWKPLWWLALQNVFLLAAGALPYGLGLLLAVPLTLLTFYASYSDIYEN